MSQEELAQIFRYRPRRDMVSRETSRSILKHVLYGHAMALILPVVLGIVLGWFDFSPPPSVTIEMGEMVDPGDSSEPPGEAAAQDPAPSPPEPVPQLPELPAVSRPEMPDMPVVQTPDSTLPDLAPPPVATPSRPNRPTPPPKPVKQETPKSSASTPAAAVTPAKNADAGKSPGRVHDDGWKPGTGTASDTPGTSGAIAPGYGGQLKNYIDRLWIDAPTDAPAEFANREVRLTLDIAADGTIISCRMEKSGYPVLDESVERLCGRLKKAPAPGRRLRGFVVNLNIRPE